MSFSSFVTTKLIKLLYILLIVVAVLFALVMVAGAARHGGSEILLAIILAPIAFVLFVLTGRVYLELIIVVFRIAEDIRKIANQQGGRSPEG